MSPKESPIALLLTFATAYDATRALIAGLQRSNKPVALQQALQDPSFSTDGSGDLV